VVRRRDPSFPTLCGEVKGERFVLASAETAEVLAGEPGQIVPGSADEGTVEPIEESEPQEKKAELNPLEKHMAGIFVGREKTIEDLRIDLETEREARELEAAAYRNEVKRLTDLVNALRGTVSAQGDELEAKDKLIKKLYEDLDEARRERDEATRSDLLRDAHDQLHDVMDQVMDLNAEVHKKDELIVAMAKAIFLGEKEVLLA
jgi:small-conductance mechanosensitive channel